MSTTILSTATPSSTYPASNYPEKQTPMLPDDFLAERQASREASQKRYAEAAQAEQAIAANSVEDPVWATLTIGSQTVTVGQYGSVTYTYNGQGDNFLQAGKGFDLDWEKLDTPEEVAEAIMAKYSGTLTASPVESGDKSMTSELMSKMFSSDALINRMFLTEDGGSMEDGLTDTDEASASAATVAAGDLQAVQTQTAAV